MSETAEILAKEMQAIVAANIWKGHESSGAPPVKWRHLSAETQQFWIDTASRILVAIQPADLAQAKDAEIERLCAERNRAIADALEHEVMRKKAEADLADMMRQRDAALAQRDEAGEWNRGYAVACGLIERLGGETTLAAEVLNQSGLSWDEIAALGLGEYDMTQLRKIASDPSCAVLRKIGGAA